MGQPDYGSAMFVLFILPVVGIVAICAGLILVFAGSSKDWATMKTLGFIVIALGLFMCFFAWSAWRL